MQKKVLEIYKVKGKEITGEPDFPALLRELLHNLGASSPALREGSLDILWELIEEDKLSDSVLLETGDQLAENLRHGAGERDTDSVFLRTFSALLVGVILSQDEIRERRRGSGPAPFLPRERFKAWYDASKEYVRNEKDLRGYVPGKGWAHALSHGPDLLRDCAFHRFSRGDEHAEILAILSATLLENSTEVLVNNDDNRLARVVVTIMLRESLRKEEYEHWLKGLLEAMEERQLLDFQEDPHKTVVRFNIITFLRALYFVLEKGMKNLKGIDFFAGRPPGENEMKHAVLETLTTIDNGLNYRV